MLFDDGLLAYQGEGVFTWIPADAFATPADYETTAGLFRQKIAAQKDFRPHRPPA